MPRGASIWKLRMAFSWVLMEPPSIWMAVDGTFHSSSSRAIQTDSGVLPLPPSGFLPPVQNTSGALPERYSRKATNRRSLGSISPVKWCRVVGMRMVPPRTTIACAGGTSKPES